MTETESPDLLRRFHDEFRWDQVPKRPPKVGNTTASAPSSGNSVPIRTSGAMRAAPPRLGWARKATSGNSAASACTVANPAIIGAISTVSTPASRARRICARIWPWWPDRLGA